MNEVLSANSPAVAGGGRFDVAIVGGGPAALMAAIAASSRGKSVVVIERTNKIGGKLAVAGGGHCNISSDSELDVYYKRLNPNGRFARDALRHLSPEALREFFGNLGLQCVIDDDGKVFPVSRRSGDVISALADKLSRSSVTVARGQRVSEIILADNASDGGGTGDTGRALPSVAGAVCADGQRYMADAVILACGAMTYPGLGTTGDGYELARQLGYTIVPPRCALAGLRVLRSRKLGKYAGLTLDDAQLTLKGRSRHSWQARGGLLITHEGLSGPAALDISTHVSQLLAASSSPVTLQVSWRSDFNIAELQNTISRWRTTNGSRRVINLLTELAGKAIAKLAMDFSWLDGDLVAAQSPGDMPQKLSQALAACPLEIVGVDDEKKAMVTAGGVSLKQIDPRTMAGRLHTGLHFAGELVDIDGPTGGFNLQWAMSSGHLAGSSV